MLISSVSCAICIPISWLSLDYLYKLLLKVNLWTMDYSKNNCSLIQRSMSPRDWQCTHKHKHTVNANIWKHTADFPSIPLQPGEQRSCTTVTSFNNYNPNFCASYCSGVRAVFQTALSATSPFPLRHTETPSSVCGRVHHAPLDSDQTGGRKQSRLPDETEGCQFMQQLICMLGYKEESQHMLSFIPPSLCLVPTMLLGKKEECLCWMRVKSLRNSNLVWKYSRWFTCSKLLDYRPRCTEISLCESSQCGLRSYVMHV